MDSAGRGMGSKSHPLRHYRLHHRQGRHYRQNRHWDEDRAMPNQPGEMQKQGRPMLPYN
jgi:hypothetical protein